MNKKDIRKDIEKAVSEFFKHAGKYPNILEISPQIYLELEKICDNWTAMVYIPSRGRKKIINQYAGMDIYIADNVDEDYIVVRRVDF